MIRLIATFLLALLAFDCAGFYLVHAVVLQSVTAEMHQQADSAAKYADSYAGAKKANIFRFFPGEYEHLQWHEYSKEFRYRGEMYDVVSMRDSAGITIVECYHDERETRALASVAAHQSGDKPSAGRGESSARLLVEKSSNTYLPPFTTVAILTLTSRIPLVRETPSALPDRFSEVASPPPKA